jgi:hypothetical protein
MALSLCSGILYAAAGLLAMSEPAHGAALLTLLLMMTIVTGGNLRVADVLRSGRIQTRVLLLGGIASIVIGALIYLTLPWPLGSRHVNCDRAVRTGELVVLCRTGVAGRLNLAGGVGPSRVAWHPCLLAVGRPGTGTTVMGLRPLATRMAAPTIRYADGERIGMDLATERLSGV